MPFQDRKGRVHKEIIVAPDKQPLFIFGYGSLLSPQGINGRGMRHKYTMAELLPCRLNNYRRNMGGFYVYKNFYGILPEEKAFCNGVVFPIHERWDYYALMHSEGATKGMIMACVNAYLPKIVTKDISGVELPENAKVVAVVLERDRSLEGVASPNYIRLCEEGARAHGEDFLKEFYETGGWKFDEEEYLKYRRQQYDRLSSSSTGGRKRVRSVRKRKSRTVRENPAFGRRAGSVQLSGSESEDAG